MILVRIERLYPSLLRHPLTPLKPQSASHSDVFIKLLALRDPTFPQKVAKNRRNVNISQRKRHGRGGLSTAS
eukprot:4874626-Pyramimonas_sp.AAC.1